jgi:HEAT repeat protein
VASWPDLVAIASDRSAGEDRATACWLLGRIGDKRAAGPLAAALRDADAGTRMAAAYALGLLGDPRATGPLLAALADTSEDPRVRGHAAEAFTWHRERRAVQPAAIDKIRARLPEKRNASRVPFTDA